LIATIATFSLVPPWLRPVTHIPHAVEHALVFFAASLALGLGYPQRASFQFVALILFTGAIELAQLLVAGRHARWSDFLVNALGVCIGLALAQIIHFRAPGPGTVVKHGVKP
jgi:VanZ family protein